MVPYLFFKKNHGTSFKVTHFQARQNGKIWSIIMPIEEVIKSFLNTLMIFHLWSMNVFIFFSIEILKESGMISNLEINWDKVIAY
jgi:hypothetical protein